MIELKKKSGSESKLKNSLGKSPINYFSDLFIAFMVVAWICVVVVMVIMAMYSTIIYADNSIWCEIGTLVSVPLSCGGAIWMIKNSVQHAIASSRGEQVKADFPAVDASEEIIGPEKEFTMGGGSDGAVG